LVALCCRHPPPLPLLPLRMGVILWLLRMPVGGRAPRKPENAQGAMECGSEAAAVEFERTAVAAATALQRTCPRLPLNRCALPRDCACVPNPSIREVEGGRAHGLAPLCRRRLDPGGVGVGLALPSSGPAETRGRQAAPLRRAGYRRIGRMRRAALQLSWVGYILNKFRRHYKNPVSCVNSRRVYPAV